MRIFCAVRHSTDPGHYYGELWSGNFYPALRQLGHEVVESQVDLLQASRFMDVAGPFTAQELEVRATLTQAILDELQQAHKQKPVDLFLGYFYNSHFDPAGFAEIRKLGIPSVNFYCNSIYQFELTADIAPMVDFAWHAEKHAEPLYRQVKANPVWVQMGADPTVYAPIAGIHRVSMACFVGQRYADRDRLVAALVKAQIPLVVYGSGWTRNDGAKLNGKNGDGYGEYLGRKTSVPQSLRSYFQVVGRNIHSDGLARGLTRSWRQNEYRKETHNLTPLFQGIAKGSIAFDEMRRAFSAHEVILNFSKVWADGRPGSQLISHVRLRDFEAPMCRTCYLTEYSEELAEFYDLGKEVLVYRTTEELLDKTKYYLAHTDEAEKIRAAGYERALRDHTWVQRFKQLFKLIGLVDETG